MLMFVDETENKEFFIVTALLVNSKEQVGQAYKTFKHRAGNMNLSNKDKTRVFTEFKATLLAKIVSSIACEISVIFDTFNMASFEEAIKNRIISYSNVKSIESQDSQKEAGLQFIDNISSVIRLKLSNEDKDNFYSIIEKETKWI